MAGFFLNAEDGWMVGHAICPVGYVAPAERPGCNNFHFHPFPI